MLADASTHKTDIFCLRSGTNRHYIYITYAYMYICKYIYLYIYIYIYIANPELAKKVAKADLIIYQIAINLHFF